MREEYLFKTKTFFNFFKNTPTRWLNTLAISQTIFPLCWSNNFHCFLILVLTLFLLVFNLNRCTTPSYKALKVSIIKVSCFNTRPPRFLLAFSSARRNRLRNRSRHEENEATTREVVVPGRIQDLQ